MKLSMRFSQTRIAERFPGAIVALNDSPMPAFSASGVITPTTKPADEVVYIDLLPFKVRTLPPRASVITTESRADLFERCNLIVLPDGTDLAAVADLVSETFTRYFGWADAVYAAIAKNEDLQTIIDLTAALVNNPMYIADSSFKMLASWGGEFNEINPTWRYQQKYHYLPYQVMQALVDSGELDLIHDTPSAWLDDHSIGFTSLPFISKAIRKDGTHYGNFFIIELYRHLDACDVEIADYLGDVLSSALYGNRNYLETSTFYHAHFLEDVIEGTLTDRTLVTEQLTALHWTLTGDYLLALFDTAKDNDAIRHHMMALLSTDLDVQCIDYRGDVLAIASDCAGRVEKIEARLKQVARDFNRDAAVSERFVDFLQIGGYYQQARFTLDAVAGAEVHGRLLVYRDMVLDHITGKLDEILPVFAPVTLLDRYDRAHGTEYCRTLYVWLACERNTVKAASVLYIHRNTLKNRLEHIQEIAPTDTDDLRVRMRYLLSLHELPVCKGIPGIAP